MIDNHLSAQYVIHDDKTHGLYSISSVPFISLRKKMTKEKRHLRRNALKKLRNNHTGTAP